MAKYVLVYTGGGEMGDGPEAQEAIMNAWMGWFGSLGDNVVDMGNPLGASSTVAGDGTVAEPAPTALGGYSIINAESMADAQSKVKTCPALAGGGTVEIYEAVPIM